MSETATALRRLGDVLWEIPAGARRQITGAQLRRELGLAARVARLVPLGVIKG